MTAVLSEMEALLLALLVSGGKLPSAVQVKRVARLQVAAARQSKCAALMFLKRWKEKLTEHP